MVCVGAVVPISVEISAEARESVVAPIAAACCPAWGPRAEVAIWVTAARLSSDAYGA
jgi:hypothetical protein